MQIREFEPDDFGKGFFDTLSNLSTSKIFIDNALKAFEDMKKSGCYKIFVMVEDDKIIGTVTLFLEQKFIHDAGIVGHIEDVATRKGWEGKGIGSRLIKHAMDKAGHLGCYKIILDCGEHNIQFYEKQGFHKHEICMRYDIKKVIFNEAH